jgi:hypothetical protein
VVDAGLGRDQRGVARWRNSHSASAEVGPVRMSATGDRPSPVLPGMALESRLPWFSRSARGTESLQTLRGRKPDSNF